ncbi:MAG: DNA-directed RNA polymerase subunit alpha, partial [Spirochaetales bacterium]|nr:DNA-directed RNA polymerase subunit alpha [Spirochaetales bacterium]
IDETIEVLNPDYHLFTLSDKGNVVVELQIDLSRGYVDADRQEEYIESLDTIPIDAMFSPIEKVKYDVVNTRVGSRNDFDKIIFELWTDGTIKPEDALAGAAKILKEHLQIFINFEEEADESEMELSREDDSRKQLFETPIDELELSVRASNCLRTVNIRTIGDLVSKSEEHISKIRAFGKKSLLEIKEKLAKQKLTFGMEEEVSKVLNKKKS